MNGRCANSGSNRSRRVEDEVMKKKLWKRQREVQEGEEDIERGGEETLALFHSLARARAQKHELEGRREREQKGEGRGREEAHKLFRAV